MKVVLTALFSEKYPSVGESHGLSVLAGQIRRDCRETVSELGLLDMVATGRDARSELIQMVESMRPDVVGFSVTYGTFSKLTELVPVIRALTGDGCQFVYGGALATYLAEDIIVEVDAAGLVFAGEGEIGFATFLNGRLNRDRLNAIPNAVYRDATGSLVRTARALSDTAKVADPDRSHLAPLVPLGIQLYTEASRGCSWAHCTFCLRGLLDIEGTGREYRRLAPERLARDFTRIRAMGASSVTFADEDLLGHSPEQLAEIVDSIEKAFAPAEVQIGYDASATVHSVFSRSRSAQHQLERERLIARLASCGLRKIFLGVESGSTTQLRRFAKGHTREEAAAAIQLLRRHNIVVELGWIMFDPLCTLAEIRENVGFLLENDAVDATSYLFNELRLQRGTSFERLLDTHAKRGGHRLHGLQFDKDTLSFDYEYQDRDVANLVVLTRDWAQSLRPIHYPLKNLTRFGAGGSLAGHLDTPRRLLSELRKGMCLAFLAQVDRVEGGAGESAEVAIERLLFDVAKRYLDWLADQPEDVRKLELVQNLADNATLIRSSEISSNNQSANTASYRDIHSA